MKAAARVLLLTSFVTMPLGALAQSAVRCDAIFGPNKAAAPVDVRINDLLQYHNEPASRLTENFKLELAGLFQMIEKMYGPRALKGQSLGVDWPQMKTNALREANKLESSNDQYIQISNLMFAFNDAHVSVELPSSLVFNLPIKMRAAEGRFLVDATNPKYPAGVRRPAPGDEVLQIDGIAPGEYRNRFAEWNAVGNDLTAQSIFGLQFAAWKEGRGLPLSKIKEKGLTLTIQSRATGEIFDVVLDFQKEGVGLIGKDLDLRDPNPETVIGHVHPKAIGTKALSAQAPHAANAINRYHDLFRTEVRHDTAAAKDENAWGMNIGQQKPFFKLPLTFEKIEIPAALKKIPMIGDFLTVSDHYAGTFAHNGKKVGFLRIPSYGPENLNAAVVTLRYLIARLENETDYLVIDQTNNPGGYVLYSDMLVKSLAGKFDESKHLRFAVKPSQNFLREFAEMRNEVRDNKDGLLTKIEAASYAERLDAEYAKVYEAFTEGKNMSEPISMLVMTEYFEKTLDRLLVSDTLGGMTIGKRIANLIGEDVRTQTHYTKPVYFMINELDFSGGDATPASLQDYGRVKLIGTRTAGAGGTVEEFSLRALSEMKIHLTTSLMVRYNGKLVENYGVHPDIEVPLRAADVQESYAAYFRRFMFAIDADQAKTQEN